MSNTQFVSAMAVASALNTLASLLAIVINDSKLRGLGAKGDSLFRRVDGRFDAIDRRFDEMRDLCIADLRRFERTILDRLERLDGQD
jgi:hypothetical protein